MYGLFHFFNRAYRGHVMPHQLEGFKLMERARASHRRLLWGMIVAIALTGPIAFWAYLSDGYRYSGAIGYAWRPFNKLQSWLYHPLSPDYGAMGGLNLRHDYNAISDGDADAFYLVGFSSGGIRSLQQLVNECVLGFDFCELVAKTNFVKIGRC